MRPRFGKIIKTTLAVSAFLTVLLLSFAYVQYRELKKTFIGRLSDKATAVVGQKVEIGDLSFSPAAGINFYDISIRNPQGFESGRLLHVKRLYLKMNLGELFRQRLSFKEIAVDSPELTIIKDAKGIVNVSEKLFHFIEKKSAYPYHIDEFKVSSGDFELSGDDRYNLKNIDLQLKNLSSESGVKTLVRGSISYGESKIKAAGWIFLKDEPKRLNISVSSADLALRPMEAFFEGHGIDTKKTRVGFDLNAEGDMGKGFYLKSEVRIVEAGFTFLRKKIREISLSTRAFLSIPDRALSVNSASLQTGGITAAEASGQVKKRGDDFFYSGSLKIESLDLSAFNFMKNVKVRGTMVSDNIHFLGDLKKRMPEIDGTVQVRDAALSSKSGDIGSMRALLKFSWGRVKIVKAEGTGEITKLYGYTFEKPVSTSVSLNAAQHAQQWSVASSLNLSPIDTKVKGGKKVRFDRIFLAADTNVEGETFSGKARIEAKGASFADYRIPVTKVTSSFLLRRNVLAVENLAAEGDLKASAKSVKIIFPEEAREKKVTIEMENTAASYPLKDAGFKDADISLRMNTGEDSLSGDFGFSVAGILIKGLHAGPVAGSGRFDNKDFSVDVTGLKISGGGVRLKAAGKTAEGPFPLRISSTAEDIDMGDLVKETSKILAIPYDISGDLKRGKFDGTVYSAASIQGDGEMRAEKIYLRKKDSKRNILKDVSLRGGIEFRGEDLDFRADADAGKVSTTISGRVKSFMRENRSAGVSVGLHRVDAADIRDAFWDMFPDSLLYAGMDGSVSSDVSIDYGGRNLKVEGKLTFQDLALRGENGEYSIGPINGTLPVAYSKTDGGKEIIRMPLFERSEFNSLSRYYSQKISKAGYSRITIGSLNYGFRFLADVSIWVKQSGSVLNVEHFSGNILGGRLNGSAVLDMSNGFGYSAGFLLEGLSLRRLCEEIEPIKGYISGKVDGIAILKGAGPGVSGVIGKADLWAYGTADEKTIISKEFLHRMGGPSMKAYLGDRPFDKGTMSLYLQNGFVIFKELEISHRNFFGMTDLSIKVAPFSNRIAIDDLMWSITEAAQRAKKE